MENPDRPEGVDSNRPDYTLRMTITLQRRLLYIPVLHIDTNLINARQKLPAVNRLEQWYAEGVILINMSGTARGEAMAGGNVQRSRKANQQIFTLAPAPQFDTARYKAIEDLIFPGGREGRKPTERRASSRRCDPLRGNPRNARWRLKVAPLGVY
jgi:hypothetical protein